MFKRRFIFMMVILLCAALVVSAGACGRDRTTDEDDDPPVVDDPPPVDPDPGPGDDQRKLVHLYFAGPDETHLFVEYRLVEVPVDLETAIVEALIDGPEATDLLPTMPEDTALLDIWVIDRVAHVDLSMEFADNHPGGTAAELLTLYSVVHSLAQLDHVDSVQFRLEGQVLDSILGHLATDIPLRPDPNLIRVTK